MAIGLSTSAKETSNSFKESLELLYYNDESGRCNKVRALFDWQVKRSQIHESMKGSLFFNSSLADTNFEVNGVKKDK